MTVIVGMNKVKIIILTRPISCLTGAVNEQLCDYLKYITLRVLEPCTSQAGCLSPCLVCLGSSECANFLIGISSWYADDGQ